MGFLEAIKSAYMNMFNFKDRAARPAYWWFQLYYAGLYLVSEEILQSFPGLIGQVGYSLRLFMMVSIVAAVAVSVRRLHDSGRSGFWFLAVFVPIIGQLYFLYLMVLSGTDGANQYGPQPGYDGELGWMSPVERSERIAIAKLDTGDTLERFIRAYEQQEFQTCWDILLAVGMHSKDIHSLMSGIREHDFVPTAILARRQPAQD